MFDKKYFELALANYKKDFSIRWENEKYKWEAVKTFQDNWDIQAENFADMLENSIPEEIKSGLRKFVYIASLGLIEHLAKNDSESVKRMFINLFDENKDPFERIDNFQKSSEELKKIYPKGKTNAPGANEISPYLWLRYPDKYYVYNEKRIKSIVKALQGDYTFRDKDYANNFRKGYDFYNEICAELKKDNDLINILKSHITDTCYPDPELKTLTIDFGYYISEQESKVKNSPSNAKIKYDSQQNIDWYPKNYDPGLSVDDWLALLKDNNIFTSSTLEIMKRFLDFGGAATCTQLSNKYGEDKNFYNSGSAYLAKRIAEKINCPVSKREDGTTQWWAILYLGRTTQNDEVGSFVWKIRDELVEALSQIDLSGVKLYSKYIPEPYTKENFLNEVYISEEKYNILAAVLKNKKNIILQGAPGVGKTFAAKRLAYSIMGEKDENRIEFVQFHQNYSYEDFIMGYKPTDKNFELRHGIFYNFCKKAADDSQRDYFFIIDEINRGNMSKIFGELLMLIEKDYRNTSIKLAYNDENFSVPENLYIIGMMNTADRSLAMIDYALRRRFSFFDMEPAFDSEGFVEYQNQLASETLNKLINVVKNLNKEISADRSLGKGFCIGHSYFCGCTDCDEIWLKSIVDYDILPMLSEYWFDDTDKLQHWENILRGVFND